MSDLTAVAANGALSRVREFRPLSRMWSPEPMWTEM